MIEPIVRLTGSVLMAAAWCARLFWYHAVPLFVVLWATYVVQVYRVRGNAVLALLPVVGVVMAALWTVFLLSELLNVLNANDRLARVVKYIERGSLIVIGAYGVLAGLLWINGQSAGPVVRQSARVLAITKSRFGPIRYTWWTVASAAGERQRVLRLPSDASHVYVGGDAELVLRQGRLLLWRVVEVRRDEEQYLLSMLAAMPRSHTALAGLVSLYTDRGELDRGIQSYAALTRVYPDEPDVGYRLGTKLIDTHRYRDGADILQQVVTMRRDYAGLYTLGYALAWAGDKHEAAKYLREATKLAPDDFRAFYSLGYVMRDTGQYAEAKVAWSKVLELRPDFPEVQANLRAIEGKIQPTRRGMK